VALRAPKLVLPTPSRLASGFPLGPSSLPDRRDERAMAVRVRGAPRHVVFGEDEALPLRSDDTRLPPQLRLKDPGSPGGCVATTGFWRSPGAPGTSGICAGADFSVIWSNQSLCTAVRRKDALSLNSPRCFPDVRPTPRTAQ
jgi:hypothetical protein